MSSDDKRGGGSGRDKDKKGRGKSGDKVVTLAGKGAATEAAGPGMVKAAAKTSQAQPATRGKAAARSKARRKTALLSSALDSELAVAILEELYPLLLENCTDEDDEVDTQAVFEVLAGMVGLFAADYQSHYGHEKAMNAVRDLLELSLSLYQERVGD